MTDGRWFSRSHPLMAGFAPGAPDRAPRAIPDPGSHGSRPREGIYKRYTKPGGPGVTSRGYTNPGVVARNSRRSLRIRITNRVSTVAPEGSRPPRAYAGLSDGWGEMT